MRIEDIRIIGGPLVLTDPAAVETLESQLWIRFPEGYREFVTRLGEGILGGSFVRIYPPWRIEKELAEWRRRISKYWFWDEGRELLPKERALECIIVGDTMNGDELVFHPSRPGSLFVLPRDSETVFVAGSDLLAAIEWMCSSGDLTEPFAERNFEPFDGRNVPDELEDRPGRVVDPEGESLDDILELARRWANRHSARKVAQEGLKEQTRKKKTTGKLLCEALVLERQSPYEPGYLAAYRIDDETGQEVGFYASQKSDNVAGGFYAPVQTNAPKLRG